MQVPSDIGEWLLAEGLASVAEYAGDDRGGMADVAELAAVIASDSAVLVTLLDEPRVLRSVARELVHRKRSKPLWLHARGPGGEVTLELMREQEDEPGGGVRSGEVRGLVADPKLTRTHQTLVPVGPRHRQHGVTGDLERLCPQGSAEATLVLLASWPAAGASLPRSGPGGAVAGSRGGGRGRILVVRPCRERSARPDWRRQIAHLLSRA